MSTSANCGTTHTISGTTVQYKPKAKVSIKFSEMCKAMSEHAIRIADDALSRHLSEVDLAEQLKKSFDSTYPGLWHCAVGRHFEPALTHRRGSLLHFHIECLSVILFQCEQS
ncbi:Dynein light chain [Toxocara canis]|uniref:Dynein light chain n=1 Tax=Toxocara canis TaxID=6265 RepID=A0A0B2UUS9_TOXCA|nr:Dynein light chain [Toxocara canis]